MLVIALTSIPPRLPLLGPVLGSLLDQGADKVVLALPKSWHRFPGDWPLPPLPDGVTVLRGPDHGPATKVLAARAAFPAAEIVYCDDDCLYGPGWLEALRGVTGPVIAGSVFDVARLKRRGGRVAQGFAGVRVAPGVPLPAAIPPPVLAADDLYLSAWFEMNAISVRCAPTARACVTPLDRPDGLQNGNRPVTYARAAEWIDGEMGVWPRLSAPFSAPFSAP